MKVPLVQYVNIRIVWACCGRSSHVIHWKAHSIRLLSSNGNSIITNPANLFSYQINLTSHKHYVLFYILFQANPGARPTADCPPPKWWAGSDAEHGIPNACVQLVCVYKLHYMSFCSAHIPGHPVDFWLLSYCIVSMLLNIPQENYAYCLLSLFKPSNNPTF